MPVKEIVPAEIITHVYQPFVDTNTVYRHFNALLKKGEGMTFESATGFFETLKQLAHPLTKEIQFNDWLFESIRKVLQPRGYVIESNKENCDCSLNEYWKSRSAHLCTPSRIASS